MSKSTISEKPSINTKTGVFVRRTHTHKSLTVRECSIAPYLIGKLADSPAPEGFKIDKATLNRAFGIVGGFAMAIFEEAEKSVAHLEALAKKGDDEASKQLLAVKKALEEMYTFRKTGKLDTLLEHVRVAKAEVAAREQKPVAKAKATRKPSKAERKVQRAQAAQPAQPAQAAQAAQAAAATTEAPPAVV